MVGVIDLRNRQLLSPTSASPRTKSRTGQRLEMSFFYYPALAEQDFSRLSRRSSPTDVPVEEFLNRF